MSDHAQRSSGWQLDQRAPDAYEQYLVPAIFDQWTERLIDRAAIREGDRVLDVACGTGVVARLAAEHAGATGSVLGVDINEGMLSVARRTATGIEPPIEWRQGSATELPVDEDRFDVVLCQQALQFFEDPSAALAEMRRVLVPDGGAFVSVWRSLDHQPAYEVFAALLERHIGSEAGTMMRSPFPAWDREYLRTLAGEAGFGDVSIGIEVGSARYPSVEEFVRQEAASSPLAEPIAAVDPTTREALVEDVGTELDGYLDDEGIVLPMESYVVTARP